MNELPLITVVLPVYNGEKHLRKSIDSILRQTYANFELIIVNDCSTDNTLDILQEYLAKDNRIKIVNNKENLKLPRSLNAGFAEAKGEYFTWTSDDNLYKENAFEVMASRLKKCPDIDLVYSDYSYIDEDDIVTGMELAPEPDCIVTGNVCGASFMYTKRVAEQVGEYDPDLFLAEDYDYWLRIFAISKMFHLAGVDLYYYRRHSSSLTETQRSKIVAQTFRTFKKNFTTMHKAAVRTNQEQEFFDKLYEYAADEHRKEADSLLSLIGSKEYLRSYRRKMLIRKGKALCKGMIHVLKKPFWVIHDSKVNSVLNDLNNGYKYVHIIHNDKFCCSFVEFINEQFDKNEHMFIIAKSFDDLPFPTAENVFRFYQLKNMDFTSTKIKKVILHSLFLGQLEYWAQHIELLKEKVYWMMWGADLYEAPRTEVDDLVRKSFYGYISDTDGDCKVVKDKYQLSNDKIFIDAAYTFPITMEMIENARKQHKHHDYIQIQINNSCDWSIIDMLKKMEKFRDRNIRVVCVLSYGEGERCKQEIIRTGKKIFGDKFDYLDKMCSPQEYAYWLANNDIYILNQNRQQGLGNSFASLALGVKLYIKSSVTTYHHFNDKGIKVYDTLQIQDMTYDELISYDEKIKNRNKSGVEYFFDNTYLKKCWEPVFYDKGK